jgi:lysophospholipid acyltransferase (LPLAT)-like uncharacterized protein
VSGVRRWVRRMLRSNILRAALCWTMQLYIRLVYATNRWTVEGEEWPRRFLQDGRGFISSFWHGRLMMMPMGWQGLAPIHMLISAHRDGQIIADVITYFDVQSIPGSTRRGGSAALRQMLKRLDAGDCIGITPDGPRGPAMVASIGIVNLARLSRAPIIPAAYATSRRCILRTWDRFHLALPFGRGIFIWGEPIEIAPDLDAAALEQVRLLVETRLNELVREADRRVGHAVKLQRPDQVDPARSEEPTGGGPRQTSRPVSGRSAIAAEEQLRASEGQRP